MHLHTRKRHIQTSVRVHPTELPVPLSKHAPGNDQYGYEDAGERWVPVHSVESIVSLATDNRLPFS